MHKMRKKVDNVLDKLNKTKLLLIKASSLLKKNDPAVNGDIIATLNEAHSFLKTPEGADDSKFFLYFLCFSSLHTNSI